MRKCMILTSIILFLPSMLVAQIGGARPAGTENETRATVAIPIFAITTTALTGGKDRALSISIATSVSPPT